MLCVPIQKLKENLPTGTMVEFRLDLFEKIDVEKLGKLRESITSPVIFKCRDSCDRFLGLKPDYFDLDSTTKKHVVDALKGRFSKILISYHNFEKTPEDLEMILNEMQMLSGDLYKIACTAKTTNDALRMLSFLRKHAPIVAHCMGEKGEVTRILAPLFGAPWSYVTLSEEEKTAEGQLTINEMKIFDIQRLKKDFSIFALIGCNLKKRKSHLYHNRVMKELNLNAIYVKMPLEDPSELEEFFRLSKAIGIRGLSVTDPLKEKVIPFLDVICPYAEEVGAVNTISFEERGLVGANTDGFGALDAIEEQVLVKGKRVTVIGAGGSARAIIFEAVKRGAHVTILNRTIGKACALASKWSVEAGGLEDLQECDILINTTPWVPERFKCGLAMDIAVDKKKTPFLERALKNGSKCLDGGAMWKRQAFGQYCIWFPTLKSSLKLLNFKY